MVATNRTIMLEEDYHDLPGFFRARRVHLVASLPCCLEETLSVLHDVDRPEDVDAVTLCEAMLDMGGAPSL